MVSVNREVLTLQLGHYASSVGTHWWNLQDAAMCYASQTKQRDPEICYDVMFRAGLTPSGQETYTPRLLLMDLKGSLNSLNQEGSLYAEETVGQAVAWQGTMTTHQEEPPVKNPFLQDLADLEQGDRFGAGFLAPRFSSEDLPHGLHQGAAPEVPGKTYHLESSIRVWSDYLRLHLHPKTVLTVHRYQHEGYCDRLEAFGQGASLLDDPADLKELEDRLHFFIEECDYLQGFQVLCDMHNGFSGVAAKVTEILHDEYPGKGILTWGMSPAVHAEMNPVSEVYRLLNSVLSIAALSNHSSLFCPLSLSGGLGRRPGPSPTFPHVLYDASLNYHTSALLATSLETLSIPYRLHAAPLTMGQLADGLSFSGRKVATVWASVPFPIQQSSSLTDALCSNLGAVPWEPLSCVQQRDSQCFAQSVVLRGIAPENWSSPFCSSNRGTRSTGMYQTREELLEGFLHSLYPETLSASHVVQSPCWVEPPFPQFFSPDTSPDGLIIDQPPRPPAAVRSIPVLTALQSSAALRATLQGLCEEVSKLNVRRWASYFTGGLEPDDCLEALEDLHTLALCYKGSVDMTQSEDDSD